MASSRMFANISVMSKHGDWRGALDMLKEMGRKGIVANTNVQRPDLGV